MNAFPMNILVASDNSPESRKAIEYAAAIAAPTSSELHLVHVGLVSRFTNPDQMNSRQREQLETEARSRLDKEIAWGTENGIEFTETHLRMGRTDGEVIRIAQKIEAGMIVVGNRGAGAVARFLLGSDAESIVRHAPCPVFVVRVD